MPTLRDDELETPAERFTSEQARRKEQWQAMTDDLKSVVALEAAVKQAEVALEDVKRQRVEAEELFLTSRDIADSTDTTYVIEGYAVKLGSAGLGSTLNRTNWKIHHIEKVNVLD